MKAIVMAGGEGTRLRPITGGRPKPMAEILGRPVLEHTVELLKRHGFTELCFTLRYLPGVIEDWFGDGSAFGVKIEYSVEREPLGTAGGVRACRSFIGDDDFLVISGDAVCSFDLSEAFRVHRERGAEATILVTEHPSPTGYGLVMTEPDGRVRSFVEKPSWEFVTTDRVNTGIYVLSPTVIDSIGQGSVCDFGKELFPKLVAEGRGVYAYTAEGYWCDIGSPEAYLRCSIDAISGALPLDKGVRERDSGVFTKSRIPNGAVVKAPCYIGSGCLIEAGAVVGPEAVISDGSAVLAGAEVARSVLNGAVVRGGAKVTGAVVGRGALIGGGAEIGEECVVGDGAVVGAGAVIRRGVRLDTRRTVREGELVSESRMGEGPWERPSVNNGVIEGDVASTLPARHAVDIGAAIGKDGRVGIAYTGGGGARLIAESLVCGVTGAGGEGYELDARFEAELAFAVREYGLTCGVFARQDGETVRLSVYGPGGVTAGAELTRRIENASNIDSPRVSAGAVGQVTRITGVDRVNMARILSGTDRAHAPAAVAGAGGENRALRRLVSELAPAGAGPILTTLTGGAALTAVDEEGENVDAARMAAITALALIKLGESAVAVGPDAPHVIEEAAGKYGARVLRRFRDEGAEETMARLPHMTDALRATEAILAVMARDGATLHELSKELPEFYEASRRTEVGFSRARAMKLLSAREEFAAEISPGLTAETDGGRVRIYPSHGAQSLEIRGEAPTRYDAEELCRRFEGLVREIEEEESVNKT